MCSPCGPGQHTLQAKLRRAAEGLAAIRRLLEPAEVVLAGEPNAGKSTLANALVGRPASIVHETPGTTRDWVRELALIHGLPVWITDTAGLWRGEGGGPHLRFTAGEGAVSSGRTGGVSPARDPLASQIERQADSRARQRISGADVVLLLTQHHGPTPDWLAGKTVLHIWPKTDINPAPSSCKSIAVSAKTGEGMDHLRLAILRALDLARFDPAQPRAFTSRQGFLLLGAAEAMSHKVGRSAEQALRQLLEGAQHPTASRSPGVF